MSLFGSIAISGTGIDAAQTWIDTSAGNIANMNDAAPTSGPAYQEQTPVLVPAGAAPGAPGEGVAVAGVQLGSAAGRLVYDPTNPLADAQGMVRYPAVDLGTQLVDLVEAQNDYEANAAAIARAKAAYQSALTLGS